MRLITAASDGPGYHDVLARSFAGWHDVLERGSTYGRPVPARWPAAQALADVRQPASWDVLELVLATDDEGRPLGGASLEMPQRENTHLVGVELAVAPEHRGRGVGRALLAAVCDVAERRGRTSLVAEISMPADPALADPQTWPGAVFARRAGLAVGLEDVRRDLALPADDAILQRLEREASPHAAGYALTVTRGVPAEGDLPAVAELSSRMGSEAPQGELDVEPEQFDTARVVELHERARQRGIELWTALARDAEGATAAYSVLARSEHEPDVLYQWDTLVLPEHRGHRLGLLLKIAALHRLWADGQAEGWAGALRTLRTWNAAGNAPMIAVNEAMGFTVAERMLEVQGDVATVRSALAGAHVGAGVTARGGQDA